MLADVLAQNGQGLRNMGLDGIGGDIQLAGDLLVAFFLFFAHIIDPAALGRQGAKGSFHQLIMALQLLGAVGLLRVPGSLVIIYQLVFQLAAGGNFLIDIDGPVMADAKQVAAKGRFDLQPVADFPDLYEYIVHEVFGQLRDLHQGEPVAVYVLAIPIVQQPKSGDLIVCQQLQQRRIGVCGIIRNDRNVLHPKITN